MSSRYPIPAGRLRVEVIVQRSRFIATADHTPTVAEARQLLEELRDEFPDATHHVHAFAVGYGASVTHGMSDDGEPAGTAGKPTLTVVENSGLGDICVIITRYFGGTKLGTGGLVKAYTAACKKVLEEIERTEKVDLHTLQVTIPYPAFEACKRLVTRHAGTLADEAYGESIAFSVTLPIEEIEGFRRSIGDATSGGARIESVDRPEEA